MTLGRKAPTPPPDDQFRPAPPPAPPRPRSVLRDLACSRCGLSLAEHVDGRGAWVTCGPPPLPGCDCPQCLNRAAPEGAVPPERRVMDAETRAKLDATAAKVREEMRPLTDPLKHSRPTGEDYAIRIGPAPFASAVPPESQEATCPVVAGLNGTTAPCQLTRGHAGSHRHDNRCGVTLTWGSYPLDAPIPVPAPEDRERERLAKLCEAAAGHACGYSGWESDKRDLLTIAAILRGEAS